MTTTAEAAVVITARDRASAVLRQFGRTVDETTSRLQRMTAPLSRVSSIMSTFGLGALVGVTSITQVVQRVQEWHQANARFEAGLRTAQLQLSLMGLSTDLLAERMRILERSLSRTAVAGLPQVKGGLEEFARASGDAAAQAGEMARRLIEFFGLTGKVTEEELAVAVLRAHRGELEDINKLLPVTIENEQQFREVLHQVSEFEPPPLAERWGETLQGAFERARDVFERFRSGELVLVGMDAMNQFLRGLTGVDLQRAMQPVLDWFQVRMPGLFGEGGVLRQAWRGAVDFMAGSLGALAFPALSLAQQARELFTETIPRLWAPGSMLRNAWDAVVGWQGDILGGLQARAITIFGDIPRLVWGEGSLLRRTWEQTVEWMGQRVASMRTTFETVFRRVVDMLNQVIRTWNRLEFTLPSAEVFGHRIGGMTIGTPDIPLIPQFQHGGIVQRPTLALLGEAGPEAVVPLRRRPEALQPITVNVIVDGQVVKRIAVEGVREAFVRAGLGPGAFAPGV